MPKLKTNKAAAKRLRARAGSLKRKKAFHSHILTKKTTKRCRNLRQRGTLLMGEGIDLPRLFPYIAK